MVAGDSLSPQEGGGAIWATCRGWGWGQGRVFFVCVPRAQCWHYKVLTMFME